MNPPPLPFGDPVRVHQDNQSAVGKGLLAGCGGCALIMTLVFAFVIGIAVFAFSLMRQSDAYQLALAKAKASPQVQRILGQPIEAGWFFTGSIQVSSDSTGSSGSANLSIPLSGPKNRGVLYAVAKKQNGEWVFTELALRVDGSKIVIDLLNPSPMTLWQPEPASPAPRWAMVESLNPAGL